MSEQNISLFLEIVNSSNREEARQMLATTNSLENQRLENQSAIPLNDEQKEYLSKKNKFTNRKLEYEKQKPSILGSSIKNIMSYFSSSNTTASQFLETLKFKPAIDMLDLDLDQTISQFDLEKKKSILIIYIKPNDCSLSLEKLEQKIFQSERLTTICEKSVLTGVLQNAQTLYRLNNKNPPCFVVLYRNKIDELIESVPIQLTANQQTENQILDQIEINVSNAYEIIKHEKQFKKEVKRIIKHNKQILMQNQMSNIFQSHINMNNNINNNHQRIIQESEQMEQQRLLRQYQQQQHNQYNLEQERKNIKLEEERRLKQEQEIKYQEMLKNQQNQREVQKTEQKNLENKQQKIQRLKNKFKERKLSKDSTITFAIRLPNGQRIMEDFGNETQVQQIYDFVYIQEKKGFQDEDHEFEVFSCGFPPQKLENEKKIKEYFGDSDQEALTIREVFKQLK